VEVTVTVNPLLQIAVNFVTDTVCSVVVRRLRFVTLSVERLMDAVFATVPLRARVAVVSAKLGMTAATTRATVNRTLNVE
jgi:hypothetical protein